MNNKMRRWWSHENVVKFVVLDRHQMIKIAENLLLVIKIITKIQRHERETEALSKIILLLNISEKVVQRQKQSEVSADSMKSDLFSYNAWKWEKWFQRKTLQNK